MAADGSLFNELRRRNVIRAAAGYLVVAWLIVQVVETIAGIFGLPARLGQVIVIVLAIGFVPACVVAWVFELTSDGLVRDRGSERPADPSLNRRFDRIIILTLAAAVVLFGVHTFVLDPIADREAIEAARREAEISVLKGAYGDKSIAVLPFTNMSSDPEQEYFGDGLAEQLLHLLEQVPNLLVVSRTSSFSFKGSNLTTKDIAEQLGVVHILEGSVRKSGNRLRITAQLIDARIDAHVWSQTYDRELADIFDIQDEVATNVVNELKVEMNVGMPAADRRDPEAYTLYLRAREHLNAENLELLDDIEAWLDRALELDPAFVDAEALQVRLYLAQAEAAGIAGDEDRHADYFQKHTALVEALRERAPDNVNVIRVLAWKALLFDGDLPAAARLLERAMAAAPRDSDVLLAALTLATQLNQVDLAIRIGEFVLERDPLYFWVHTNLADAYTRAGRFDDAVEHFRIAASLSPDAPATHWKLGTALVFAGRPDKAIESLQRELATAYRLHGLAVAYHSMGDDRASDEALQELLSDPADEQEWPFGFARVYAWRGDADKAFEYLRVIQRENPSRLSGIATNPYFQPIHGDPRWQPFIEGIDELMPTVNFHPNLPSEVREAAPADRSGNDRER